MFFQVAHKQEAFDFFNKDWENEERTSEMSQDEELSEKISTEGGMNFLFKLKNGFTQKLCGGGHKYFVAIPFTEKVLSISDFYLQQKFNSFSI